MFRSVKNLISPHIMLHDTKDEVASYVALGWFDVKTNV
jgi:hypothetical protein